jgi:hypothetical protein
VAPADVAAAAACALRALVSDGDASLAPGARCILCHAAHGSECEDGGVGDAGGEGGAGGDIQDPAYREAERMRNCEAEHRPWGIAVWLAPVVTAMWRAANRATLAVRYATEGGCDSTRWCLEYGLLDAARHENDTCFELGTARSKRPRVARALRVARAGVAAVLEEDDARHAQDELDALERHEAVKWDRGTRDTDYDYDEALDLTTREVAALRRAAKPKRRRTLVPSHKPL